jgi:TM2 domain-containing membrane protein YozV
MDQQFLLRMFPDMEYDEMATVMQIMQKLNENEQQTFLAIFQGKRKDHQQLLLFTLLGFFGAAGIQRFLIGDIGLGIVYLVTGGLCLIGTIVDIINIKNLAARYNQKMAYEAANITTANFKMN